MSRIQLLVRHSVTPVVVFDGDKLPVKDGTESSRFKCVLSVALPPSRPCRLSTGCHLQAMSYLDQVLVALLALDRCC